MDYFCRQINFSMDAVWYGIAAAFEWIFAVAKSIGPAVNVFFIAFGVIGTAFWLWYGESTRKGGDNFLAEKADKK
jgi:hypothetical protein